MGVVVNNECCHCAVPGYPCLGDSCTKRNVKTYFCNECKRDYEPEELYVTPDGDLCEECILNKYQTVAQILEKEC